MPVVKQEQQQKKTSKIYRTTNPAESTKYTAQEKYQKAKAEKGDRPKIILPRSAKPEELYECENSIYATACIWPNGGAESHLIHNIIPPSPELERILGLHYQPMSSSFMPYRKVKSFLSAIRTPLGCPIPVSWRLSPTLDYSDNEIVFCDKVDLKRYSQLKAKSKRLIKRKAT